jgi:hypothetical protein
MTQPKTSDWKPVPDPTALTTDQLRRELAGLREILETRLDGMDKATGVLDETVNRTPTVIQSAVAAFHAVYDERFSSANQQIDGLRGIYDERFSSVQKQFRERDVRTDQAATASASALAAALQAAKEAVFEQAQAAAKAAEKTELSFTKQIDQIGLQISTVAKGFDDRIGELKERIDRGEGSSAGTAAQLLDQRADAGFAHTTLTDRAAQTKATISIGIAAISGLVAVIVGILVIVKG